jgi:hypothetical protein
MGLFKTVGSKLKRVVSIKNLVRGVTGNFSAIGEDALRIVNSSDPKSTPVNPVVYNQPQMQMPPVVADVIKSQEMKYKKNVVDSIAKIPAVQEGNNWATKIYLKAMFLKYRTYLIGLGLFVGVLLIFRLLKGKNGARPRKRS